MKKFFLATMGVLAMVASHTALAGYQKRPVPPPAQEDHVVTLYADMSLQVCKDKSFCYSTNSEAANHEILLSQMGDMQFHFQGHLSMIRVIEGKRYIGIVTVDYFKSIVEAPEPPNRGPSPDDPSPIPGDYYAVTVELIGVDVPGAKMVVETDSINNLRMATLFAPIIDIPGGTLEATMTIGPVVDTCKKDSPGSECPMPEPEPPVHRQPAQWNVLMGTLK